MVRQHQPGQATRTQSNRKDIISHLPAVRKQKEGKMRKNLKEARQKAGMTQQQVADKLGLTLRHYQKIEYADLNGSFEVWDALEDILGIHQRILRERSDKNPFQE